MHEATTIPTLTSDTSENLTAAARTAESWFGEPFLQPDEDPLQALAPGTARRSALDDALAEMDAGRRRRRPAGRCATGSCSASSACSPRTRPRTAAGTELRRHQIDALAGMLTELIAATQRPAEENGNGNGQRRRQRRRAPTRSPTRRTTTTSTRASSTTSSASPRFTGRRSRRGPALPLPPPDRLRQDDRGRRLRRGGAPPRRPHPHPPPPARLPVHARPHDRGLRRPLHRRDRARARSRCRDDPITIQTYAWFARHGSETRPQRLPARHLRRGAHRARREDERRDPRLPRAALHRHDRDRAADREAGLRRLPGLGRRPAARRRRAARADRAAALPARAAGGRDQLGADRRRRLRGARARRGSRPLRRSNQAAASLYRERFGSTPGIVYAAGVEHAYNLAQEFRAAGLKAEAVSGRTPPARLAETLAAYERGEINVLINAHAPRRGLELAARDRLHAPRADRVAPRLPAAHRPDHAHAPAQGGRRRRRLRPEGRDALRARRLAALAARLRLLPRGRARHARAAPPPAAPRAPQALAGAVARPGHARRRAAGSP